MKGACARTRSPFLKRVTELPTSKTSPAISLPMMVGYWRGKMPIACVAQSTNEIATAPVLMTISVEDGGVYGAGFTSRRDFSLVNHAAVLDGMLNCGVVCCDVCGVV